MNNADRIEKLEQDIVELREKVEMYEAIMNQLQSGFAQLQQAVMGAMATIADISTTQSRQFVRVVEGMDELSQNQKDVMSRQSDFERWRSEISTPLKLPAVRPDDNTANELATLERALRAYFNEQELRDLMIDLNIDALLIGGNTHPEKCQELVDYARRHGLIKRLAKRASKLRPHALIIPDTGPL